MSARGWRLGRLFGPAKAAITTAMNGKRAIIVAMTGMLAISAAGCERFKPTVSSEPYIFYAGEYDRTRSNFGQMPKTITEVRICYRRDKATPAQIGEMARDECARFGKTAIFVGNDYLNCPLLVPAEAFYRCLGPGEKLLQDEEERVARMKARM